MSGGVTVHGGSDGIQAEIDDMVTARGMFSRAADQVENVIGRCFWQSITLADASGSGDLWGGLNAQDALRSAVTTLRGLDDQIRGQSAVLTLAIAAYRDCDDGVLDRFASVVTTSYEAAVKLPGAVIGGTEALWNDGAGAALQTFLTHDPELIDTTVGALGYAVPPVDVALFKLLADAYFDDGHARVSSRPDLRPEATAPPRNLADLLAGLGVRNDGAHGEVDVKILTSPDGRRRVVVDIPGTKDWTPAHETPDVVGWAANIRAIAGGDTTYENGVLEAMRQAGVRPADDVMVVGHSLGGMVAVALARDAARSGRFNVTHVLTAGSPIGKFVGNLPANVQVLALENKHDVVPHLDGVENPDLPNVTTATFDIDDDSVGDNHGIGTAYVPGAAEVDASDDPAIRAFLAGAGGYFGATAVRTHAYVITRD